MNESRFLKHIPCPRCNSKDNLALYEGGSGWCFGCGYFQKPKGSPYGNLQQRLEEEPRRPLQSYQGRKESPSDEITSWLSKYGVTVDELQARGAYASGNRLTFSFTGEAASTDEGISRADGRDGQRDGGTEAVILRQTRIFPTEAEARENPKQRRFYTEGKTDNCLPIYYQRNPRQLSQQLVVVEDPISAIKIARFNDSMPCLSSDLSRDKLRRLRRRYGAFLVWLDSDMYPKAQRIAQRLQLLGAEARAIWTEHDPKVYQNEEIKSLLLTGD